MNAIKNIRLLQGNAIIENKAILYERRIIDIIDEDKLAKHADLDIIDGNGMFLSSGFIDVHVHGCSSFDTMDSDDDNLEIISKNLARTGVTAFLPTTMTLGLDEIQMALEKIRRNKDTVSGAQILGCHLEGPFISKIFKGAHDENFIIPPNHALIEKYADVIRVITLAPELEGSAEFIDLCNKLGIVVSIGHTNANYETASEAIHKGARHFTHTFNAMTPLKHRDPGAVGAAMLHDVTCELIADNVHIHPAALKLMARVKGQRGIILVTDAMRACLMCDGTYQLGGQDVIVSEKQARLKDGTLAGSVLTLNAALKNMIAASGVDLPNAIDMITANPARMLGMETRKGSVDTGMDADFAIFDDNYNIHYTIAGGKIIYRS